MSRLCILLSSLALLLSGCGVSVAVRSDPTNITGGAHSAIRATVSTKAGMVAAAAGPVTFTVNQGGTVSPSPVTSDGSTGIADTDFAASAVHQPTLATITATYDGHSGTADVMIVPPPVTASFTTTTGDDVTVNPVVSHPDGWQWVYTITPGKGKRAITQVSVLLDHDATVTCSVGTTPRGIGALPNRNFEISTGYTTTPFTITVTGSGLAPGGATTLDIAHFGAGTPPSPILHARITTLVGPAP